MVWDNLKIRDKKVLVTGGLGFIGSNLVHRLVELGATVTIYDVLDPHSGGNMYNVRSIEDNIELVINDIRNFESISSAIRGKDYVFNCAAFTSHPNSMKEPLMDIDVNCKGVINILEAIKRFNPDAKLIHVGTSTQIGRMINGSIDELHPEYPVDIYSANKSASEKYVLVYANSYNLRAGVVRLANCYGPRSNIKSADFGFINFFIGLALQNKSISIFGEGAQIRNFTYVDDAVNGLITAALDDTSNGKSYFAVSDEHFSVSEVTSEITDIIGGKVNYVEWPSDRMAIEIGDARISNGKFKKDFGWYSEFSLKEGLNATKEYFSKDLKHYLS